MIGQIFSGKFRPVESPDRGHNLERSEATRSRNFIRKERDNEALQVSKKIPVAFCLVVSLSEQRG